MAKHIPEKNMFSPNDIDKSREEEIFEIPRWRFAGKANLHSQLSLADQIGCAALLIYSLYKVKDFPVSTLYPVTCMYIAKGFPFFPVKCMSIEKGFPVTEKNL